MPENRNKGLLRELWDFLRVRKAWWLTPIIVLLLLIATLLIVGQGGTVSPFIYMLF